MGAKKLNYSVCIDAVFRESKLSFVEAMSVIHRLGYKAYEFWSWKDKDIKRIKERNRTKDSSFLYGVY